MFSQLFLLGFIIGSTVICEYLRDKDNIQEDVLVATTEDEIIEVNRFQKMHDDTLEYWSNLTFDEQESYLDDNIILRDYKYELQYSSRYQTAKHVADLAYKLGREFTNRYRTY